MDQCNKGATMKTNKVINFKNKKLKFKKDVKPSNSLTNEILNLQNKQSKSDIEGLLCESNDNISVSDRNKIIVQYLPMIRFIARKISSRLPAHIDHEDLISSGVIGLMDAIKKYDATRNNKFKTYAEFRVHGAILDALRSQDWIPRSIRDKTKKINKVTRELEQKYAKTPKSTEIAKALNISIDKYHDILTETKKVNIISIDESLFFSKMDKFSVLTLLENKKSSFNILNKKAIQKIITQSIEDLPERQRMVLSLYYYEEFNLRKIGQILKVTESRVSQLHAQAIERLKSKLVKKIKEEELKAA